MRQFSVTCSNVFSNQSASSFENELAQPLDFGHANNENWRVSLAELAYTPHQFHNIRPSNNRLDIGIRDMYYPIYSPHNVEYAGWDVPENPKYFNKPLIKTVRAHTPASSIEAANIDPIRPGSQRSFRPFKGGTAPHLRIWFYWHADSLGKEGGYYYYNVHYHGWDSLKNRDPTRFLYHFNLNEETYANSTFERHGYEFTRQPFTTMFATVRPINAHGNANKLYHPNSAGGRPIKTLDVYIPSGHYDLSSFVKAFNTTIENGMERLYGSGKKAIGWTSWPPYYNGPSEPSVFYLTSQVLTIKGKSVDRFVFYIDKDYLLATNLSIRLNPNLTRMMGFGFLPQHQEWVQASTKVHNMNYLVMKGYIVQPPIIQWLPTNKYPHMSYTNYNEVLAPTIDPTLQPSEFSQVALIAEKPAADVINQDRSIRANVTYLNKTMKEAYSLDSAIDHVYILCDICKPIQVNAYRMNVLRMVVLDKLEPAIQMTFPLQLRKICKSFVNSIQIKLVEELETETPIDGTIYVKLIFYRIS